jgi:alkane 1-monooxygenase
MIRALPYWMALSPFGLLALSYMLGDGWTFLPFLVIFGGIGAADLVLGPGGDAVPADTPARWYALVPILWVPLQLAVIGWTIWMATHGATPLEIAGMTLSTGLIGGIGIVIAHELTHRLNTGERLAADALMVSVTYHHFCIEHVHGHHRTVGTPDDPATARFGQSYWAFLPQTLYGSLVSAWRLEAARLKRRNRPVFHWRNRVLMGFVATGVLYLGIGLGFGWLGVVVLAGIGTVAILELEVINYIEHYGLTRKRLNNDRYERIQPHHSWDDNHRLTRWFLANLPRHADHHMRPGVRYHELRAMKEAAQLPFGYATMFLIALFPPLWFRMMNPRVEVWRAAHAG